MIHMEANLLKGTTYQAFERHEETNNYKNDDI